MEEVKSCPCLNLYAAEWLYALKHYKSSQICLSSARILMEIDTETKCPSARVLSENQQQLQRC